MQRASTSTERTPLVQPTYMFESSITRNYRKRLRNFQCAICIGLMLILGTGLLVTVGYNLSQDMNADNSTEMDVPETVIPDATNVSATPNLTGVDPGLRPLLMLSWPLEGKPPSKWGGTPPTPESISSALKHGRAELVKRTDLEKFRKPLEGNTPASRAQRAAATAADVKPMADEAYVVEEATRALLNGTDVSSRYGGVGQGPRTDGWVGQGPRSDGGVGQDPSTDSGVGQDPSPDGGVVEPAYCRPAPPCAPSKYRTINGTCNNLENSNRWGVSHIPFRRVLPPDYGDGISSPRTGVNGTALPSARDVSVTVHRPSYAHDSSFTVMLAVWGQFIDHDITATALSKGSNSSSLSCCDPSLPVHPECFPVPLDPQDPFYQKYNLSCMEFVRSAPAPTCHFGPREQLNQATAFLDGSTVYGFNSVRQSRLRAFTGGQLKMLMVGSRQLLPQSTDPNDGCNTKPMADKGRYCFETGDDRANENLHLTTMHLIWARQHNRLAAILSKLNPSWADETLYQEARRIVGAQMQHIAFNEFLPAILGNDVMYSLNLTLESDGCSSSYNSSVDPSIANHFSAAAFRFAHTLLPGLIRSADLTNGSMNFVQLHSMLFNPYTLYQAGGAKNAMFSAMGTSVHSEGPHVTSELSNHLFEKPIPLNSTSAKPAPCGLDLVSLNVQRGRDHGLPPYPAWREYCGFTRPESFEDLEGVFDDMSLGRIKEIYSDVNDIDLYTGALAELPRGKLLGATLTCLISDQFLRLKVGDRFWYETCDEEVGFTAAQLSEIRKTSLAGVICANEGLLEEAQPRVMESISETNPLMDCMEIPQPDWTPWKEGGKAKTKKV